MSIREAYGAAFFSVFGCVDCTHAHAPQCGHLYGDYIAKVEKSSIFGEANVASRIGPAKSFRHTRFSDQKIKELSGVKFFGSKFRVKKLHEVSSAAVYFHNRVFPP
jgi:hypothetical protein